MDRETRNEAINCAARAMRAENSRNPEEHWFLKQWRKLPHDIGINHSINHFGNILVTVGVSLFALIALLFTGVQFYGKANSVAALGIEFSPFHIRIVEDSQARMLEEEAERVVTQIKDTYPPGATGVWRVLPWNWDEAPMIPENAVNAFKIIKGYRNIKHYVTRRASKDLENISPLADILPSRIDYDNLRQALIGYVDGFSDVRKNDYLVYILDYYEIVAIITIIMAMLYHLRKDRKEWMMRMVTIMIGTGMIIGVAMEMGMVIMVMLMATVMGRMRMGIMVVVILTCMVAIMGIEKSVLTGIVCTLPISMGYLLSKTKFPRNPLASALEDLPRAGRK
uniref:Uncharacterized protein n=1 Tax=Candidatus Kentrum sp. FM TaxID=2126340 RepID=A0A450U1P0_9GAMM|nr:MAG: hypothetical protein BECKFM1743C_GA0114222_101541 [Candidatus Kentron sp. FM]VFJ76583.1 MAG: hypothetical protein BECKFM1743A_GA0114220_109331 [Candidatus Kentron sp. FM]VFK14095.1 MAG: hypothetical protein BECKFM1743B_GA0114221_103062 [Candidatus Kentron sp. FM]